MGGREGGFRNKGSGIGKMFSVICIGVALTLVGIFVAKVVQAVDPSFREGIPGYNAGYFELEGDALYNSPDYGASPAKNDWENVLDGIGSVDFEPVARTECTNGNCQWVCDTDYNTLCPPGPGATVVYNGLLADPPNASIFVQGSKDIDDIPDWTCRDQASPDKNELTAAYAVAYDIGGELVVYFGAERYDNAGDAVMGFWLLQSSIAQEGEFALKCLPEGDGKFRDANGDNILHVDHDILIVSEFTAGGTEHEIVVFEWLDGVLVERYRGNFADCATLNTGEGEICATINVNEEESPWVYIPKGADFDSNFIPDGFMEGGINLTRIFQQNGNGGNVPCFSTFLAETRSSTSDTASQKDFVVGSFEVCDISITKDCYDVDVSEGEDYFIYTYNGLVTNEGFGTLYNITVNDKTAGKEIEIDLPDGLAPGASAAYSGTFNSVTYNAINEVEVLAASSPTGQQTLRDTESAQCPEALRTPSISVTKSCSATLTYNTSLVGLVAEVTNTYNACNTSSNVTLENVTLTDERDFESTVIYNDIAPIAPGDCTGPIDVTYRPTSYNSITCCFTDTVTATATGKLTSGVAYNSASASCPLCSGCGSCP